MMIPVWMAVFAVLVAVAATYFVCRALARHELALRESLMHQEQALLEERLRAEREKLRQHLADAEQMRKQTRADFENLANKIFDAKQQQFSLQSRETLDLTMRPLKQQIDGFRKRIDEIHSTDTAERNQLKGQIEELQKQASKIGDDAISLAKALKGESKTQGNWGEMILERLLEESGLVKGREYETQTAFKDASGSRKNPDVLVRLPEGKDIVIDAKVSLTAYEQFCSTENEQERQSHLGAHIASLRSHIRGLSQKSYEDLEGLRTLDFVLMFVPVEPAFLLALEHDSGLFREAYERNIILVCPTTLLATLRTVQSIWRYEKQNRNALEIAERAGRLHDQFVLFVESLDDVGKHLNKSLGSYEEARKRLIDGRGNLVKRSDDLRVLGAKTQKQIPDSVSDGLDPEDPGTSEATSSPKTDDNG